MRALLFKESSTGMYIDYKSIYMPLVLTLRAVGNSTKH